MEYSFKTVQKKIGLLISFVGMMVVITNFISSVQISGYLLAFRESIVWLVFLTTIPFIFSIFFENRILKILQVFVFLISGIISVIQDYEGFYGPALFLASWLLMRQYGYLEKHQKIKNISLLLGLVAVSQISANLFTNEGAYAGFSTLWFALFLTALVLIVWHDMIKQQNELKRENSSLYTNYKELTVKLEEIENSKKPYDLKASKISPAEERVIRALTVYKASNREIAERLNIAESTVKLHLYNIYNKIGVDNRFAVIDLCKYNYPAE